MKKIGRKTLEWIKARGKLEKIYLEKGITQCEANLVGCWKGFTLNFAHRYKRSDPRCRHTFKQTILCCNPCHQELEQDETLTEMVFKYLRGSSDPLTYSKYYVYNS